MAIEQMRGGAVGATYQDKIRALQEEITQKSKEVTKLLESNIDTILEEVVVNVEFGDYRRDIVFQMIESYFDLIGIPVNSVWVWNELRTRGLAYETRDEIGHGDHEYFIHLTEKGLSVRSTEGGIKHGS